MLQPIDTFGNGGRDELVGPDLRTVDLALSTFLGLSRLGAGRGNVELRAAVFNLFNRASFGPPSLVAFAGSADSEAPLVARPDSHGDYFGAAEAVGTARQLLTARRPPVAAGVTASSEAGPVRSRDRDEWSCRWWRPA